MKTFHKVIEKNNWQSLTFFVGEKELAPGTWTVRWPDGTEEKVSVVVHYERHSYSDHSIHQTHVTSQVPFLVVEHHGAKLAVRATEAGCEFLA